MLRYPFCRRACCRIDPDKLSASQPNNDQNVEQVKADGWDHEQIHGCDARRMVPHKRAPALPEWVASPGHVLGDGRLSDRKAELEQLTVDAWRTPKRILNAHPPDQRPQIRIDLRPTSKRSRFPPPIAAKAGTMPAHEGLGPKDRHGLEDRRKPTIQLDEEQPITVREEYAPTHLALQHDQLMSERRILCFKPALRLERQGQQRQKEA